MQKSRAFMFLLAFCWFAFQAAPLSAQEEWDEWDFGAMDLYARGDQTITISLGISLPTVFLDHQGGTLHHNFSPPVGGAGSITYTHFLGSNFFLGGEIGVSFSHTVGRNTLFIIPIGLQAGWQFLLGRFEFPLSLTFGIAPQRYLDATYTGMFLRAGASAFYRFSPDWSFGVNLGWNWYPQRPNEYNTRPRDMNVHANILGITISARYHF